MNRVAALVDSALRNAWAFDELPWHVQVDPERESFPEESFFARGLRSFQAMAAPKRRAFVFRETCFHLSNLLAGEHSGEQLVAQVMVLTAHDRPGDREFLALMAQEEAKHFLALQRYLSEKAGILYPPCRRLRASLAAVEECASPEVKLLVGQIVFEWTAASLVATLLTRAREPLLSAVLRANLRDEARHLAYGHELRGPLARALADGVPPEMEPRRIGGFAAGLRPPLGFASLRASLAGGARRGRRWRPAAR